MVGLVRRPLREIWVAAQPDPARETFRRSGLSGDDRMDQVKRLSGKDGGSW